MIPKIRKVEPQDLCDGMHILDYKYKVSVGKVNYICHTKTQAVWIWVKGLIGII